MNQPRLSHQPGDYLDPGREHYRILERLNQGGMGTVYKVIKEPTQTEYAVKECDLLDDPRRRGMPRAEAVRIFISEASSIEQLKIEGIPQGFLMVEPQTDLAICLACGNTVSGSSCVQCKPTADSLYATPQVVENRYYLVMDFIAGQDADERVRDWPQPLAAHQASEVVTWLADIARVLTELHRRHLVHRDIKPGNIRIRETDGRRFLLDFGLLRLESGSAKTRVLQPKTTYNLGTEGFAAPEQRRGEPCPASDIYALAMTAVALLTGADPGNPVEAQRIEATPIEELLPVLSPAAQDIVHRSLSPDPSPRPDAAEWAAVFGRADAVGGQVASGQSKAKAPASRSRSRRKSGGGLKLPAFARSKKVWLAAVAVLLVVWWFGIRNPIDPDALKATAYEHALLYAKPDENAFLERLKGGEQLWVKDTGNRDGTYWLRVFSVDGKRRKAYVRRDHIEIRRERSAP